MDKIEIKIENIKASIAVTDLKCVDCFGDPKIHVGFNVEFNSFDYKFSTSFKDKLHKWFKSNKIVDGTKFSVDYFLY